MGIAANKWLFPSFFLLGIYSLIILNLKKSFKFIFFLPFLFFAGFYYAHVSIPSGPPEITSWMEQRKKVDLSATIKTVRGYPGQRLSIELDNVVCTTSKNLHQHLDGITVWTWYKPEFRPVKGQQIKLHTRVKPIIGYRNPECWDYTFYARTKNRMYRIFTNGVLKDAVFTPPAPSFFSDLKTAYNNLVISLSPDTQGGSFFPALLSGDRFFLNTQTVDLLRRAGLSHTLALSGLHIGFVVGIGCFIAMFYGYLFPRLYLYIPRQKLAVLICFPLVLFYLWMGGFTASLLRSSCMFFFWGILLVLDRPRVLLDGLFLAVLAIVIVSPLAIFDIGLQFSALAVLGISLFFKFFYYPFTKMHFYGSAPLKFIGGVFAVSIGANILLLPLIIWNFGTFTPNFLFNLIWVPLLGTIIMPVCVFGGLFLAFFSHGAGEFLFSIGANIISHAISLLNYANHAGFLPEISCYRPFWSGITAYFLLLFIIIMWSYKRKFPYLFLSIFLILCGISLYKIHSADGNFKISVLDTGQSQSVFVKTPAGKKILVDGGGTFGSFDIGRSIVAPVLTYGSLPAVDEVILSHKDYDHSEGLAFILENFKVGEFCFNGHYPSGKLGRRIKKALNLNKIKIRVLHSGDIVEVEPGVVINVYNPDKSYNGSSNNRSLALRIVSNGQGIVFLPGDIEKKSIANILKNDRDLSSKLLLLPHHGSRSSFSPAFYKRVNPVAAVAACGLFNRFGFVAETVREELKDEKIRLYTTSECGAVEFIVNSDGTLKEQY
ncbi:DNA internalization-related competence protein ComEC/Rec2 [Maridesulfovibrio bastinii]|uniref:DNA internalization-related competence protein ComEC/Rec2 n=1 Tax=Maridesulfovibrio bastinii TaxID=47157 RepID=UPI001FDF4963|nr:DNA internalization-related competence protein ComEC/Rec2 [Maridesulfovibrio bastinii]